MKGGETMHRRYYILIANVLRKGKQKDNDLEKVVIDKIISDFCIALKAEASSFNEQKFRDYIEGK